MIPEKYANETDYRKIPREYLNPNIPQGRGMKKWLPMATIPEQYERLEQYIQDQNKIEKPLLSEDQIENINDTLASKMIDNTLAKIQYFANGYIKSVQGIIHKVDTLDSVLYIYTDDVLMSVKLTDIYNIE
ncbi:TPA: YolD-like family protein [Staphylococcus aureus]|uniref:YolD-like family protein n=1 Tax=Staphylococcus aureus TaxID=1280 RepID=UPI000BA5CAF1|nr:YolD-like family protein [Staphylococcus aureus]HCV0717056.1 YolD-like family protein [Staphylococcus aureus]HCV1369519.1 YolD-like family protein [Staphylococcus aureus]HDA8156621.1 YolD-like family protein [Staphylococcus aureus]HDE9716606.1 YolD-like family protein [Staphylococcus aureus]HDJ3287385.1 YolD-like family protein [Staphylococcus aureus]